MGLEGTKSGTAKIWTFRRMMILPHRLPCLARWYLLEIRTKVMGKWYLLISGVLLTVLPAMAQTMNYYNYRGEFVWHSLAYDTSTYFYDRRGSLTSTARSVDGEIYLYDRRGAFAGRAREYGGEQYLYEARGRFIGRTAVGTSSLLWSCKKHIH